VEENPASAQGVMSPPPAPGHSRDDFLRLFNPNLEEAKKVYRNLRNKLVDICAHSGCLDPDDAADEAVKRAFMNWLNGEQIENLPAYIQGIAHYIVREKIRRAPAAEFVEQIYVSEPLTPHPDTLILVQQCLSQLSPEQRNLITEFYHGNKKDVQEALSINSNTLRIRACRIRKIIRDFIDKKPDDISIGL
jgi:DNA-directed RNA polymerase specialized sigma24 family protein